MKVERASEQGQDDAPNLALSLLRSLFISRALSPALALSFVLALTLTLTHGRNDGTAAFHSLRNCRSESFTEEQWN